MIYVGLVYLLWEEENWDVGFVFIFDMCKLQYWYGM